MFIAYCSACKNKVQGSEAKCPSCGASKDHFLRENDENYRKYIDPQGPRKIPTKSKCPECSLMNLNMSKFCSGCGNNLELENSQEAGEPSTIFCSECGQQQVTTNPRCSNCSADIQEQVRYHAEAVRQNQLSLRVKKGLSIARGILKAVEEASNNTRSTTDINAEIMRGIKSRTCPFCGARNIGSGPCTSCAR
jgi:predicted amidophosphoribosyltransferase